MLDDYKELCESCATAVNPGWHRLSKSDLCRMYVDYEKDKERAEGYFCALLCKYWPVAERYYYTQAIKTATEEECYTWVVDSILYVLAHKDWLDPKSSLFNDSKAPEKMINRCITCERANFYVAKSRHKRRADFNTLSLEQMITDYGDGWEVAVYDDNETSLYPIEGIILEVFERKDYFTAFAIDGVVNADCFNPKYKEASTEYEFSYSKLLKHLRTIDDDYCADFAERLRLTQEEVIDAAKYVTKLSPTKASAKLHTLFDNIRKGRQLRGLREVIMC